MAITLLTGAGASKAFDYPTTIEFFAGLSDAENKAHKEILQQLRSQLGVNTLDVEDVLSMLQPIEDFVKTPSGIFLCKKLTDGWNQRIINFAMLCRDKCFDLYGRIPDTATVKEHYQPFLDICGWKEHRISLFTTNYDPVTDMLLDLADSQSIPAHDGFSPRSRWTPEMYGKHITGLEVYRLHGSMSWINQRGEVINTRDYSLRRGKTEHLLIYPGYKGNPEEERDEVYSLPHKALRDELKESEYFIVIGFAFRDKHINRIIAESMKTNRKLKLIIINPTWPSGEDGFMDKIKDNNSSLIHHINQKFGDITLLAELAAILDKKND